MARRKYRKRRSRRRPRRRRNRIQKTLFGNSRVVKHKYSFAGQQAVSPVATLAVIESFRLLSPTDPDVSTLGTNQPLGFDQLNLLFSNCQVLGAKIRLTWLPADGAHQQVYWMSIDKVTELGSPSGNLNDILNKRNTVYRYSMNNPGSTMGTTIIRKHSPKKYNAFTDYKDADHYQCVPATQVLAAQFDNYINFGFSSSHSGVGSLSACDFALTIDYIIRWFGPINPPPS